MRSIFCEPYDEEYARLCIEKTFSDLKWELVRRKNDPPDLEDNKKHIGVEVVRAVEQKTAQIQCEYAIYCAEGRKQKRRKFLEKSQEIVSTSLYMISTEKLMESYL